ncbi:MAG: DctP family TRAP transporter solute-binding subunit, partial [Clostridia bacterium]|nr:DctP family TRAP transporter solute-binding subunit [Clostridia bacterium]
MFKRKTIRIICLCVIASLVLGLAGCGKKPAENQPATPAEDTRTWVLKAGHVLSTEHPYQLAYQKMDQLLQERTKGRIKLEIYPSSQLGNERDLFEGAQMGTVDLAVGATAPLANFNKEFLIFDLPYLFESREHAYAALDGDFGKDKFKKLEANNMIGLAYWEAGYFDVLNSKRDVKTPDDMKGLKIRVMENELFMEMINAYGATAVPMAWSEVFTSIQNGAVDGTSNPIVTIATSKLHTIAQHFTIAEPIYSPIPLIMSKATYDSMPADLQKIMRET